MFKEVKVFFQFFRSQDIAMIYRTFIKSRIALSPYALFYIVQYYRSMKQRNQVSTDKILLKVKHHNVFFFLSAHKAYFYGDYNKAINFLKKSLDVFPKHVESSYLLSQCLLKIGNTDESLNILYAVLKKSDRKKTWLYLMQAISNEEQFMQFEIEIDKYLSSYDKSLLIYYSDAAIKVGAYDKAVQKWTAGTHYIQKNKISLRELKASFSVGNAEDAILHLKSILDEENITFFLVSGTLLGCIRNNGLLPHDKDLDIGIWDTEVGLDELIRIFQSSGCFEIMPIRTKALLKLKHVNGTFIDVFIHYKEKKYNWHATSKLRWINSHFSLSTRSFLGQIFYIPENYEKYLSENYGFDWKIPKTKFDSTFDTNNARLVNAEELKVYLHRKIYEDALYQKNNQQYFVDQLRMISKAKV